LSDAQITELLAGLWYVETGTRRSPVSDHEPVPTRRKSSRIGMATGFRLSRQCPRLAAGTVIAWTVAASKYLCPSDRALEEIWESRRHPDPGGFARVGTGS